MRDIGIREGRIVALSREPLSGAEEVDATGLVSKKRGPKCALLVYIDDATS